MINIQSNMTSVIKGISDKILLAGNTQELSRTVANSMLPVVKNRIHVDGKAADDAPIGTYSTSYMRLRTGLFATNATFSKGKNKGELKPKGVFTKGKDKGKPRPNYNRTSDTKVIVSLTRQTENDFSVLPVDEAYGLGYNNVENFKKMGYVEETYKKPIAKLTASEVENANEVANEFVNNILK